MKSHHDVIWKGLPGVRTGSRKSMGERAADHMKAVLATWVALSAVLVFIAMWIVVNSHLTPKGYHFDPQPFIELNLCLSCFAALQCFVLLIANKRGEQVAAQIARHTLDLSGQNKALIEENTELTRLIHSHLTGGTSV